MSRLVLISRVWRRHLLASVVVFGLFGSVLAGPVAGQVSAPAEVDPVGVVWVLVGDTVEVDLSSAFAGAVDSYAAASSTPSTVTVSVSGSVVSLTSSTKSASRVNYSASNAAGTASGSFRLRVLAADDPPQRYGVADALELGAGDAATEVDISAHFLGPVDSYAATVPWSHPAVSGAGAYADVSMSGSVLSVRPLRAGLAGITVTATNANGSTSIDTWATVTGTAPPPAASGTLADQTVTVGGTSTVDVAGAFTGVVDSYSATSSDTTKATVTTTGSTVTLTGVAAGSVTVTVTATNPAGTANQTIDVTVGTAAPQLGTTLAAQTLNAGATLDVDIAAGFTGTVDTYDATSSDDTVLTVATSASVVTLSGVAPGSATVTVTATNPAGSATQTIAVTVEALAAPAASGTLAARTVTVGESVDVGVAGGFTGTVDTYSATSSDETKLTVATSASVVTLSGVAPGSATVTVTATNTTGSATQTIAVTVEALAAPVTSGTLAVQTVTVGAAVDVEVAAGFTGTVDTYSATSSDDTVLTVSTSASVVTLSSVAPGSATVTVTATNTAGSATQTIAVTVEALAAPAASGTLVAQTVTAGATLDVEVAAGFTGTVDTYAATSSDETVLTVSTSGSVVTVSGIAAGSATVTVTATNTTGSASQSFTVTVGELTVTASAPTYCLTGEGTPVIVAPAASRTTAPSTETVGRQGVATIDVSYTITGGSGPYTVTSPDTTAATTAARAASEDPGVMAVSCARPGINLDNVAATANVVEAGPKTIRLQVTDANGATATTDVTVEVVEDAYTTANNGGTMRAGRTYVLGTSDGWALITLPTGLDLRFEGLSEHLGDNEIAYFTDTVSGSLVLLNWTTGAEIGRSILGSTETDERAATASRSVTVLFDALARSVSNPVDISYDRTTEPSSFLWRPYEGLPADAHVGVHPKMQEGRPIRVCNAANLEDFPSADPTHSQQSLSDRFNAAFDNAISAWNAAVGSQATTGGTSHRVFIVVESRHCQDEAEYKNYDADIVIHKRNQNDVDNPVVGTFVCLSSGGCAATVYFGDFPPTIWYDIAYALRAIITGTDPDNFEWLITHELGHFLGLGDYGDYLPDYVSGTLPPACPVDQKSIYSYSQPPSQEACHSEYITTRDKNNLHAIYHPDGLIGLSVGQYGGDWEIHGRMPKDTGRIAGLPPSPSRAYQFEYNAYRIVVWARSASLGASYSFLGALEMDLEALAGGQVRINLNDLICGRIFDCHSDYDARGKVFLVVGVTRGDWKRDSSNAPWTAHSTREISAVGSGRWTLGNPVTVVAPKAPPSVLTITASRLNVTEAPGADRSADITATLDSVAWGADARVEFMVTPRGGATSSDFVVSLASSSAERALWAAILPIGQFSAALEVAAVDDSDDDGGESVEIIATASGGGIVGTLTSEPVTVRIDDNNFTVEISGDAACATGESVSLSASARGHVGRVRYAWGGATSGVGSSIAFTCPAAGSHTVTVVGTDGAAHTGSDTHTLTVRDQTLAISSSRFTVTEAPGVGRSAVVTVTLDSAATGSGATVVFAVDKRNSASDADFSVTPAGLVVAVPRGQRSADLTVAAVNDGERDRGESLLVSASATGGGITGTLTSNTVSLAIADNDFEVDIRGERACETGELVSLSASAPGAFGTVGYRWSGAISGVGTPIAFTCPAAGSHTVTVVGTDDADGTGRDSHTLRASAPLPPPLPPLPAVPGVPSGLRVTSATTSGTAASVSLSWDAEAGATSYLVGYVGAGSSQRTTATSYTFTGLSEWTEYSFAVRAENAAGRSAWSPLVRKRTPDRVSGQVAVVRMTPTSTGYDLSFAFRPTGGSRIEPALRFLRYTELDPRWWLDTSDVVRTSVSPSQTLGQVTVSREDAGKVLVCFVPNGGSRFCPSTHKFNYANATVNRWYYSSSFYFTVTDADVATAAGGAARAVEGPGTAHRLPDGEALPEWDTIEGRLEGDDGLDGSGP